MRAITIVTGYIVMTRNGVELWDAGDNVFEAFRIARRRHAIVYKVDANGDETYYDNNGNAIR